MPIVTNPRSIEARISLGEINLVINIDENFYAVGEECEVLPHNHAHYELLYLEEGRLELLIDEKADMDWYMGGFTFRTKHNLF